MLKFIYKVISFLTPFIAIYIYSLFINLASPADLTRMSYLNIDKNYRKIFKEAYQQKILFDKVETGKVGNTYDLLTIGDSFSEQDSYGYQNYFCKNSNFNLLHLDREYHNNPIEAIYGLINIGFFDTVKVKNVLIQSVERFVTKRASKIDTTVKIKFNKNNNTDDILTKKPKKLNFFSDRMFKILFNNLAYLLDDNAFFSEVYKVKTSSRLFSVAKSNLLFYHLDLEGIKTNNDSEAIEKLNFELNKISRILKSKGINLIFLTSPDKFSFYYEEIIDKDKYDKPLFFQKYLNYKKDFHYLNSDKILKELKRTKKDIYFYDDSHWSPLASEEIANQLINIINLQVSLD